MQPATQPAAARRYAPPRAAVRDIARPHASTELAERSTRLVASIADSLIFFAMVYVPLLVFAVLGGVAEGATEADVSPTMVGSVVAAGVGGIAFLWLNLKQMGATGQSLGKKYCHIKVVRSDGSPVALSRLVWLRNVVIWILSVIPLFGIVNVLFIFGESRRCLHDKLADTIVVKA